MRFMLWIAVLFGVIAILDGCAPSDCWVQVAHPPAYCISGN